MTITQVEHVLRRGQKEFPIRASNFAFPGATAEDDLSRQLSSFTRGLRGVPLDSERTTYCAWDLGSRNKRDTDGLKMQSFTWVSMTAAGRPRMT